MKKFYTSTLILLVSMFTLIGCSSSNNKESTSASTAANSNTYKDGTYKGTYDKGDKHGWKSQISIVVQGGKITKVDFNSLGTNGKLKSEDDAYEKSMKEKSSIGPKEFTPKLNEQLMSSQTASKIDGISGATQSSTEFKELSKAVLDKAKSGDTSATVLAKKE